MHLGHRRVGQSAQLGKQLIHIDLDASANVERPGVGDLQSRQISLDNIPDEHIVTGLFAVTVDQRLCP